MNALLALLLVTALVLITSGGVGLLGWHSLFGVVVPYVAIGIFLIGFVYRVVKWARAPVPFHIPTVAGQQKSLPWIRSNPVESPSSTGGVVVRMVLEALLFRSLFRNDSVELKQPEKLTYTGRLYLWLGGLAFHWSLLIILIRHLRFFMQPVPYALTFVQNLDGAFQFALPTIFITDFAILIALTYLVLRRIISPQVRYISLASDYFALFLISGAAISGLLMRLFYHVDVVAVKELAMSMIRLDPSVPAGIDGIFYVHLSLVSILLAYFPFSKLMHGPGLLFSPTRNLQNNSRRQRHINPWNPPVKVHTYDEWEDEYRDKMKKVGLPLERE